MVGTVYPDKVEIDMGWGNCGTDSRGRPIGYNFEATCDFPDCKQAIDRGLSYACGDMHGEDEVSCELYFCSKHKNNTLVDFQGMVRGVCDICYSHALAYGYDEEAETWPDE